MKLRIAGIMMLFFSAILAVLGVFLCFLNPIHVLLFSGADDIILALNMCKIVFGLPVCLLYGYFSYNLGFALLHED